MSHWILRFSSIFFSKENCCGIRVKHLVDSKMNFLQLFWKLLNIPSLMYCFRTNCLDSHCIILPLLDDIFGVIFAQIINLSEVLSIFTMKHTVCCISSYSCYTSTTGPVVETRKRNLPENSLILTSTSPLYVNVSFFASCGVLRWIFEFCFWKYYGFWNVLRIFQSIKDNTV